MGDISPHFSRAEFACKCGCGFDTVDSELLEILEAVRQHFGEPVTVTSGCRCPSWNESQGGGQTSQHLLGRACDFKVKGVEAVRVFNWCSSMWPEQYGMGCYPSWVHVDSRNYKARW